MRRLLDLGVMGATGALLLGCIVPQGRWPMGDAAHLLGISARLARELTSFEVGDFLFYWASLLAPHPPGGYLFPLIPSLMGAPKQGGQTVGSAAGL